MGAFVGLEVGERLGAFVGLFVGLRVGALVGLSVGDSVGLDVTIMPWPHFWHVLGHAASALVRIPASPRLQYLAKRRSLLAIHAHFFRFFWATLPMMADVSVHLSAREGQGMPHVTGQMVAAKGRRYPEGGLQYFALAASEL